MNNPKESRKPTSKLAVSATVFVLIAWCVPFLILSHCNWFPGWEKSTGAGDVFDVVNVLFTGLTIVGLAWTLSLQRRELRRQSENQIESAKNTNAQLLIARDHLEAVMRQAIDSNRPVISVTVWMRSDTIRILKISNVGKSPAFNLKLKLDKNFKLYGSRNRNLMDSYLFTNTISVFSQEMKVIFALAHGTELRDSSPDDTERPLVFSIDASYEFHGQEFTEKHVIDLRLFENSMVDDDFTITRLTTISDSLKAISENIRQIAVNTSNPRVE